MQLKVHSASKTKILATAGTLRQQATRKPAVNRKCGGRRLNPQFYFAACNGPRWFCIAGSSDLVSGNFLTPELKSLFRAGETSWLARHCDVRREVENKGGPDNDPLCWENPATPHPQHESAKRRKAIQKKKRKKLVLERAGIAQVPSVAKQFAKQN